MRLIDADALIEDLKTEFRDMRKLLKDPESTELQRYMMRVFMGRKVSTVVDISTAPTVDAVPVRHGKWIYGNDFHWYTASCSECGYQRRTDIKANGWNQWKYCPNCGARMVEE